MSKIQFNRLDLFLKEITDPYAQENWYRLKLFLEEGGGLGDDTINIINNIIGGAAVWEKESRTLPASSTTIVNSFALTSFRGLDYVLNFKDTTSAKQKQLKLSVIKDDGTVKDTVYARLGSAISLEINSQINGSNYELAIVNNELFDVQVSLARLTLT